MRKSARTGEFVGVISDTHGVVRPQALAALRGAALLLHAGDIGGQDVLASLAEVASRRRARQQRHRSLGAGIARGAHRHAVRASPPHAA